MSFLKRSSPRMFTKTIINISLGTFHGPSSLYVSPSKGYQVGRYVSNLTGPSYGILLADDLFRRSVGGTRINRLDLKGGSHV
jgi:hypothetical protein